MQPIASTKNDCYNCTTTTTHNVHHVETSGVLFGLMPFISAFSIIFTFAAAKLYPRLSGTNWAKSSQNELPSPLPNSKPTSSASAKKWKKFVIKSLPGIAFSINTAFSVVLVLAILTGIADVCNPKARVWSLQVAIPSILFFLVILAPALEISSVAFSTRWSFKKIRLSWLLAVAGMAIWLSLFWCFGGALLVAYSGGSYKLQEERALQGSLNRIAIMGVSLIAWLGAFGACSALWQKFGDKKKKVTEADLERKRSGLVAVEDMLSMRELRLRTLQNNMSERSPPGFMARVFRSFNNNSDVIELQTLQVEISGLQTMHEGLSNELLALETRYAAQSKSNKFLERLGSIWQFTFCLYCIYRISFTAFKTIRRMTLETGNMPLFATDPISFIVAFIARIYNPSLDRAAWSALLSILLSILMLLASLNGALQTFLTISRAFPRLFLTTARANLALLAGQILGSYVMCSALLFRSHAPTEIRSVVDKALGAPLDLPSMERWFESWFLVACVVICSAIWLGKRVKGEDWDEEEEEKEEYM